MDLDIFKLIKGLPSSAINYVVDVLKGKEEISYGKGIRALYNVIGYLLNAFEVAELQAASIDKKTFKPKKLTKVKLAASLEALAASKDWATAKTDFSWLIPILLDLAQKWLSGKKK